MKQEEQDVLIVRDEKTGEISVVAGLNKDGTPKRVPAKAEHAQDFLRFDRHGDAIDNFFKNFYRQCKEPSRFGFYRVTVEMAEQLLGVMKELLKDPTANMEMLASHKVDTSAYEKQVTEEQKKGQQTENNGQTDQENKNKEEMKEENNAQQAAATQKATAQETTGEKPTLINPDAINWQELQSKYGIDFGTMADKDRNALLNYGKTGLVTVKPTLGGETIEIQARLSFRKDKDDTLKLVPHFVRAEPRLDVEHKGYAFTDKDRKNLLRTGNLGKAVDLADPVTGELKPHFVSIDRLTKEVTDIPVDKVRIPERIGKTEITADDRQVLLAGLPLHKEIELKDGRKFSPLLQVNVEQRGVEFVPGNTQHQRKEQKQEAGQGQRQSKGDASDESKQQQQKKAHWLNEDGSIRRLATYFKKPLTEQQQDDYVAGKTIEIREVPEKDGSGTYTAYVKFDRGRQQPRSYRENPDLAQAKEQIPTNENRTQVAVNEQGKTNESTKHIGEPLKPGQDSPKNEKQQQRQDEGQKRQPKKSKGMKV